MATVGVRVNAHKYFEVEQSISELYDIRNCQQLTFYNKMNIEDWQGCDEADKYSDSVNANSRFIYYLSNNKYEYKFTDHVALAWLHLEQLRTSCARDHWNWSGYLQFATQLASNCYSKTTFFEIFAFDRKAYTVLDSVIISNSPKTVHIQT